MLITIPRLHSCSAVKTKRKLLESHFCHFLVIFFCLVCCVERLELVDLEQGDCGVVEAAQTQSLPMIDTVLGLLDVLRITAGLVQCLPDHTTFIIVH